MSDVGESGDMIDESMGSDLSKTEELFQADMVAVENSINEPRNSTLLAEPPVELDSSDIDADNSILELSVLEEQLSDLRKVLAVCQFKLILLDY